MMHQYLIDMGASIAPDKSFNFATDIGARQWLRDTSWPKVNGNIPVVSDFRYLGGRIAVSSKRKGGTANKSAAKGATMAQKSSKAACAARPQSSSHEKWSAATWGAA